MSNSETMNCPNCYHVIAVPGKELSSREMKNYMLDKIGSKASSNQPSFSKSEMKEIYNYFKGQEPTLIEGNNHG